MPEPLATIIGQLRIISIELAVLIGVTIFLETRRR